MAREKSEKKERKWLIKLKDKYRLVLLNDKTLEEKLSIRLSRLNVFVVLGSLTIFLIFITTYIIAFTPLREYIPGYASVTSQKVVYELQLKADSLESAMKEKDLYLENIKNIIAGKEIVDELPLKADTVKDYKSITLKSSKEDSSLRAEIEKQERFAVSDQEIPETEMTRRNRVSFLFFTPLKGYVTNNYNPVDGHYGIDIVAKRNEVIKSTLDGRVIFSDWTLETGYTIAIQHQDNLISVYKHNASLLKKTGSYVKAGDPVAFVGGSGELSTGPHLHFELWYNGNPVNPRDYMSF